MERKQAVNSLYACPCCGYATIAEPANFEICEICFWEDDGQDSRDTNACIGGPNAVSLTQARFNYLVYGVAERKDAAYVRPATADDVQLQRYRIEFTIVEDDLSIDDRIDIENGINS